jgi:hypothetical protein
MKKNQPVILILAHLDDQTAIRVSAYLRRRLGRERVRIITPEALALAEKICLQFDSHRFAFEIKLAGGGLIEHEAIAVVFNRMRYAPAPQFTDSSIIDQDYACSELTALWLSWLSSLICPVINPPSSRSLSGPGFSRLEWLQLAASVGMPVCEGDFNSLKTDFFKIKSGNQNYPAARSHLVAGDSITGTQESSRLNAQNDDYHLQIRHLQDRSGCTLFRIVEVADSITPSGSDWRVIDIQPFPVATSLAEIQSVVTLLELKFNISMTET